MKDGTRLVGAKTLLPPLGLLTVAALLPPEWEVRLVDLEVRPLNEKDWDWAEIVMLSGMLVQREGLLALLREARERGKITVVGGPYASSCSDDVLRVGCDFLLRGEVEHTIGELFSALSKGERSGVFSSAEKPDLAASPLPRFDLIDFNDYAVLGIQTSRGCPFECEFCDVVNVYGRRIRYKSPERVIEELEALYRLGWRNEVIFCDDNFIGSKTHAQAILQEIIPWMKARGWPFSFLTQVSVNLGQDLEMIDLMTEANFAVVFVGIETPDEESLARARKYQNIRNPLLESVNNIGKNGIAVIGSFVLGFDGEGKGAGERIAAFVAQTSIPVVMVNVLQAPPNTKLWTRLKEEGRLLKEIPDGNGTGTWPNFVPTRPVNEIMEEYGALWAHLYEPSRYLDRSYRYYLAMRPAPSAVGMRQGSGTFGNRVGFSKPPLRKRLFYLLGALRLMWWQGVKPPFRRQFWRQVVGIARNNPSRLERYLQTCALGESLIRMTPKITKKLAVHQLSRRTDSQGA